MGGELVLHLQVFGRKDDLFALHGGVDQAGHQFLSGLFDLKFRVRKKGQKEARIFTLCLPHQIDISFRQV